MVLGKREVIFLTVEFLSFGEADVEGEEGLGVGEEVLLCGEVAEVMDGGGEGNPEGAVEFGEVGRGVGEECGAVVIDAFAEEGDGGVVGEGEGLGEECGGVEECGVGGADEGAIRGADVEGGEDLVAFGVEDGEDEGEGGGGVVGDDVEGGDADELAGGDLGDGAGGGDGDAEAGEGAWAEGEVDVVDVVGGPIVGEGEGLDGGHEVGGVLVQAGKGEGGEKMGALGKGDGALSATGFDGEDAWEGGICGGVVHFGYII